MNLKEIIREIPDYPENGISFKDITTLLKDSGAFNEVVDQVYETFREKGITKIVSLESRGFIVGGAAAYLLNAGFVPIRKKGKLPAETVAESYELEYGSDTIEMHKDALSEDDVVLIHDDLLATGGTALAALNLVEKMNVKKVYFSFICDLKFITNGKKEILSNYETHTIVEY
ncbi:adenine phosphoribosyltransferase [Sunxiuqinia sp. sy24]|uniref:adenine phosphoribosyltransferase n=1 Tax=Sunxiuqinia sp. sy24 TaxID=3461495 RepID=UPI00404613C9